MRSDDFDSNSIRVEDQRTSPNQRRNGQEMAEILNALTWNQLTVIDLRDGTKNRIMRDGISHFCIRREDIARYFLELGGEENIQKAYRVAAVFPAIVEVPEDKRLRRWAEDGNDRYYWLDYAMQVRNDESRRLPVAEADACSISTPKACLRAVTEFLRR